MMTESEARAAMLRVMQQHPSLTVQGFDPFWPAKPPENRLAKFEADRAELLTPDGLEAFGRAIEWLSRFDKSKTLNRRGTSYGLKHVAQREIGYTTNGCFIAAAVAAGLEVRPASMGSLNAVFKICAEAWQHQLSMKDHQRLAAAFGRAYKAVEEFESILPDREVTFWPLRRRANAIQWSLLKIRTKLSEPRGQSARRGALIDLYLSAIFERPWWRQDETVGDAAGDAGRQ
jgi:hypothetical protein